MAINPNALDGIDGIETPEQVQDAQEQDFARSQGGTSAQAIFGAAARAGQGLFGNPRLERAQTTQQALSNAISDSDSQAPEDEDGIDAAIRRLKAAYTAVADKSPQAALQISNKLALLQQAKTQQSKLNEGIDLQNAQARKANASTDLELIQKGTRVIGNPETGRQYGTVRVFDENGNMIPGWQQEVARIKAESGDPNAQDVQQDQWYNNKYQLAVLRGQQQQALIQAKEAAKNGLSPQGLASLTAQHAIFGDGALSRVTPEERDAVRNLEAEKGISPLDMAQARAEIKANYANAQAQGRREGNVDFLSGSIPKLGENLIGAMDGITRTDFTPINAAVRIGKTKVFSSPGEQQYAAALQSFVSEYARVINGGTGQSTDSAKEEAWNVLGRDTSKDAQKAAIKFLVTREMEALKSATPLALDALRNPEHYKATLHVQQKLGIPFLQGADQLGGVVGQDSPDQQSSTAFPSNALSGGKKVVKFGDLK